MRIEEYYLQNFLYYCNAALVGRRFEEIEIMKYWTKEKILEDDMRHRLYKSKINYFN